MYTPAEKEGPAPISRKFTGKMRLRVGDTVRVIAGKDKGKEGKSAKSCRSEGKVVVEGINIVIKHQKPRPQQHRAARAAAAGRAALKWPHRCMSSKVQLWTRPMTRPSTRIGIKTDADGNRVRFAARSPGV